MPKVEKREWTVAELIEQLRTFPQDAKVRLEDADTNWTITLFSLCFLEDEHVVWVQPSEYHEMTSAGHP